MPTAAEYREQGFLVFGDLAERVADKIPGASTSFVASLLAGRLNKVKAAMVYTGDVVLPDDYKFKYMYHERLVDYIVVLWRATSFGRVSLIDAVDLYRYFKANQVERFDDLVKEVYRKLGERPPKRPRGRAGTLRLVG